MSLEKNKDEYKSEDELKDEINEREESYLDTILIKNITLR